LFQRAIASKTIETITKTNIVKITIIKRKIKRSLNLKKIKTNLSSNLTKTRTKITITKSKKLLKQ